MLHLLKKAKFALQIAYILSMKGCRCYSAHKVRISDNVEDGGDEICEEIV